jgi:hypothetical protein
MSDGRGDELRTGGWARRSTGSSPRRGDARRATLGKFARVALRTPSIDYDGRLGPNASSIIGCTTAGPPTSGPAASAGPTVAAHAATAPVRRAPG